ncbi:hypothetical protein BaRGS_00008048 [Batillaria attramentaria]|uniref:Uncharacterized protein n=1 Tax=Batillaria attramentaria TaxID=370345 RepID=A0ABD0LMY0_9CAEN
MPPSGFILASCFHRGRSTRTPVQQTTFIRQPYSGGFRSQLSRRRKPASQSQEKGILPDSTPAQLLQLKEYLACYSCPIYLQAACWTKDHCLGRVKRRGRGFGTECGKRGAV